MRSSHLISTVRSPRGTGGWELGTKNLPDLSSRMLLHQSALAMWHPTLSVGDNPAQSRRIAILKLEPLLCLLQAQPSELHRANFIFAIAQSLEERLIL